MDQNGNVRLISQAEYDYLLELTIIGQELTPNQEDEMRAFENHQEELKQSAQRSNGKSLSLSPYPSQNKNHYQPDDEKEVASINSIIIIVIVLCIALIISFMLLGFIS